MTLIDPGFDPGKTSAAIRQAVAVDADAIVTCAVDSSTQTAALKEAKDAGVALIGWLNSNDPELYDTVIQDQTTFQPQGYVVAQAAYLMGGNKLRLLMMIDPNLAIFDERVAGVKEFVDECASAGGDCEIIDEAGYEVASQSTTGVTAAVAMARRNPDYNVFFSDYDGSMAFFAPALEQAGLVKEDQFGVSFDGSSANVEMIRSGAFQQLTVGSPATWAGYAQMDAANRLIQGEPAVDEGPRFKLLTPDNVPAEGAWDGDIDAPDYYLKLWGLAE